jgi:hypothetical protein
MLSYQMQSIPRKLAAIFLFFFLHHAAQAQSLDADIEKGVRLYNELRDYIDELSPQTVKDSSIDRMKKYIADGTPYLQEARNTGTPMQQKTARYFIAFFQYELGFIYGMKGENYHAYDVFKKIDNDLQFFSDSTQYPIYYQYNNQRYGIKYANAAPSLEEYFTGMGEVCSNIQKYEEADVFLQHAISFPNTTDWYRYIAANNLWKNRRYVGKRDEEYLDRAVTALQMISRLDSSYLEVIKKNRYTNLQQLQDTIDLMLLENPAFSPDGSVYAKAALWLDSAKESASAAIFYSAALELGLKNRELLRNTISFTKRKGFSELENKAAKMLQDSYANEPDEVIRNLGTVLDKITASASDPAKHLADLRERSSRSRYYNGKVYRSSVEMPGALESFITDFLNNSQHNYFYWKSFIDEEKPANLQGRLRQRYDAICNELRSVYPEAPVSFQFNDKNYFRIHWNPHIIIQVNYYYREGYKDMILLSVEAEYPKDIK